ncbi:hypothetical protein PWG15_32590 (plasmid) [Ensifer adhaerens]|uniref:hypothetical protein n=1 Tax=Ensifer adhaerens TaxID=106592 RepID=UPI0023A9590A|nr:hypothetical protein [Ensifer adhaerens]WDZ80155.1 hypothetical protein PWG15_32590 [Ensifer adhaerens]
MMIASVNAWDQSGARRAEGKDNTGTRAIYPAPPPKSHEIMRGARSILLSRNQYIFYLRIFKN